MDNVYIATWNVLTLNRPGALKEVTEVLKKYKIKIGAIQEIRWKDRQIFDTKTHTIFCSGGTNNTLGTGFIVDRGYKHIVIGFNPINERICTLRIKLKFFKASLICAHAPTEQTNEEDKDAFYELLEEVYDKLPKHDVKMLIGDMNAKIGREPVFQPTIGKHSLHEDTNSNGMRLIDFATSKNMIIKSTCFPHKKIHKVTWRAPDGITENQIDHIVIDRRHASDIVDVRSQRGADCDSDHYLVRVKYRQRISRIRIEKGHRQAKLDVKKLMNMEIRLEYQRKLNEKILNETPENYQTDESISEKWKKIKENILEAAEKTIGLVNRTKKDDCRAKIEERNLARAKMLNRRTRENINEYKEKRKLAKRKCRMKKREREKRNLEEIQKLAENKQTRPLFGRVKEMKEGFKARTTFCRDKEGNLLGNEGEVLERWAEYFEKLLETNNNDEGLVDIMELEKEKITNTQTPKNEDYRDAEKIPSLEEIRKIIRTCRNGKAPGEDKITGELLKYGGENIVIKICDLLQKIWEEEEMPKEWNTATICPIHKKNDKSICENYRGISLLSVVYKIFSRLLAMRMEPFVESNLGDYQCGFRRNRGTTDQIFLLRTMMEKCQEFNINIHHLFVDFRQAYDSINRNKLFQVMQEFNIPQKLIRLVKMTLRSTRSKVRIQGECTREFEVRKGLRQGDVISTMLFNLCLEKVVRGIVNNRGGTIYNRSIQILAYADDVDLVGRTKTALLEGVQQLKSEARSLGLQINEDKTKYLISTKEKKKLQCTEEFDTGGEKFRRVQTFTYLGSLMTENNDVSTEIRARRAAANRAYFGIQPLIKSSIISRNMKICLYKVIIRPTIMYGCETWTLTKTDEELLNIWERKVLRKIFGPINDNGHWRIRSNKELRVVYKDLPLIDEIKIRRLQWLGHLERMKDDRAVKKIYKNNPGGARGRGRPKKRWTDNIEEDLKSLGIRDWTRKARDRDQWRSILRQARTQLGL